MLQPAGFFVVRTPLLPFATFAGWSSTGEAELSGEAAWRDRAARLREGLRAPVGDPAVREAVFVASPDLDVAIEDWLRNPDGEKGQRAERALVRYFSRMCARATPFGLFAGCSLGEIGPRTSVRLEPLARYRRHTRLDMEYMATLIAELERSPAVRAGLTYAPNNSIYRAAGRIRYVEAILRDRVRQHRLVAVDESEYLAATLERAAGGATIAALAAPLAGDDITLDDATGFIEELIDAQVLVSSLEPAVTGGEPLRELIQGLRAPAVGAAAARPGPGAVAVDPPHPAADGIAAVLAGVRDRIDELDGRAPGVPTRTYRDIAAALDLLPAPLRLPRLFQVDMTKPVSEATLGPEVVRELERAARILHALVRPPRDTPLDRFRERFAARYEGREVPLEEVLDEEVGIGFDVSNAPSAEASPLLRDLAFRREGDVDVRWSRVSTFLANRLAVALRSGAGEISISLDDALGLAGDERPPLPDAFAVTASLASGDGGFAAGDFRVLVHAVVGPSGARMLGRFCHTDADLEVHVRRHLEAEESARPDAVFAEVVHLPEGRIGNIVQRPVLRAYEIPYLGRSGAPAERRIPASDLVVSVDGDRVVLRSRRLGREVVPRMSNAHNYAMRSIGMYRFLCWLQGQGVHGQLGFDWGPLATAPFLPRVTSGRLVLARARWRIPAGDLKKLDAATPHDRHVAVQELRGRAGLPRLVALADADNELVTDLDNPLCVETLAQLAARRSEAVLTEVFPSPDELWVEGPEGRFASEVIVPFVVRPDNRPVMRQPRPSVPLTGPYPPGSEWLYLKLYCGTSTADRLLREEVAPLVRDATARHLVDRWFFIRYGDPDWHLRLRLHGDPETLARLLVDARRRLQPLLAGATVSRLVVDTYEPEAARYGGAQALPLVERIFEADSAAVLGIVELLAGDAGMDARWRLTLAGDAGMDARWRLTLRGADMLLEDLALSVGERRVLMRGMRDAYRREFHADATLRRQVGERYREEAKSLMRLVAREGDAESPLRPGLELLAQRSETIRPIATQLRALDAAGAMTVSMAELASSLVHMHANRLLRSAARAQELVLYDFLDRIYMAITERELPD